jgi:diguanylate cyclase (GGDEF)-like protein
MTAVTSNTSEYGKLDPVRGRAPARVFAALAVVVLVGAGVWGTLAATRSVQAYQHAQRLETGVSQAQYALALELNAVREADPARGRRELGPAAASFANGVRRVRVAGREVDRMLAADLRTRQEQLLASASQVFVPGGAAEVASARGRVESQASELNGLLSSALTGVRGADTWPARPVQKLELGAIALLGTLGIASCAIFLMRLVGYRRRLERARRKKLSQLEQAALSDNLTGLGNHRAFYEDLKREITRRARTGSSFSVVMLDLDRLKQINDSLGHQAGDERIRITAECLKATLRAGDGAYRTGGDEFMALLPGERAWGGLVFSQRLQAEISRRGNTVGVSCGIVESAALESADSLVRRVDIALYEAKRTGRRNVVYSDGIRPKPTDHPDDVAARRHHRLLATALAQAVDAKDVGTRNHCETVSALCVVIGQELGLEGERLEQLRLAGLLHDVGKIGIPDIVLQKPEGLDDDERKAMSGHVEIGRAIVAAAGLADEANWILHHHEHFDGSGYPDGLAGQTIPIESRIILVADAFEAMTADRPYRDARVPREAFAELVLRTGTQFDPACVNALRSVLASDVEQVPAPLATLREAARTALPPTEPKVASA